MRQYLAHQGEAGEGSFLVSDFSEAKTSGITYIDVYDDDGKWVDAFKLIDGEYTNQGW